MLKKYLLIIFLVLAAGILFAETPFKVKEVKVISPDDGYLIAPKWSPNGYFIAAAGDRYGSIWLYSVKTGMWKKLIEENGSGWDFDWSPDSKKITFRVNIFKDKRKKTTIKYIDVIANEIEGISDYGKDFSTPKWITSEIFAYLHKGKYKSFSIINKTFIEPERRLKQKNICLFSNKGIYVRKSNQKLKLLKPLKGKTFNVSFSPDGSKILFEKPGGKIYTLQERTNKIKFIAEGEMPAWSPDGNYIVYANPKDDGHNIISSDIFICDADGQNSQQITQTEEELEMRPHWSPDGKKIVCDSKGKIMLIILEIE